MKIYRLNVIEHPLLHGGFATDSPVQVIFDDHEFDWWYIDTLGNLVIGFNGKSPHTVISNGMFFKAWVQEVEHPDARATAHVPEHDCILEPVRIVDTSGENLSRELDLEGAVTGDQKKVEHEPETIPGPVE